MNMRQNCNCFFFVKWTVHKIELLSSPCWLVICFPARSLEKETFYKFKKILKGKNSLSKKLWRRKEPTDTDMLTMLHTMSEWRRQGKIWNLRRRPSLGTSKQNLLLLHSSHCMRKKGSHLDMQKRDIASNKNVVLQKH